VNVSPISPSAYGSLISPLKQIFNLQNKNKSPNGKRAPNQTVQFLPKINRQSRQQHRIQPDLKLIEKKQQHANGNRSHKIIISSTTEGSGDIDPETLGSKQRENNRK